ncbi:MAG: hypothetical protein ABJI96_22760 [Paracoccaceae bacterium]
MENEVLATVEASAGRRWIGIGALGLLGVLLVYVTFTQPATLVWQAFLLSAGVLALWMADKMRRSTIWVIELTATELRDSRGAVLARVEDMEAVDRGVFAFKPSNGFLISLKSPGKRAWLPGLWWRIGRRIGVGGLTPGAQTRVMSERLATLLTQRN